MSSLDLLLHPHLMSTDDIRNLLKMRLPSLHRIDEMPRDELLAIFQNYAAPLHQRIGKNSATSNNDPHTNPTNKRSFHNRIQTTEESFRKISIKNNSLNKTGNYHDDIDNVTNDCKKMKLKAKNDEIPRSSLRTDKLGKREPQQKVFIEESPNEKRRKKITWP